MFARLWDEKLKWAGLSTEAFSLHPGMVKTEFYDEYAKGFTVSRLRFKPLERAIVRVLGRGQGRERDFFSTITVSLGELQKILFTANVHFFRD